MEIDKRGDSKYRRKRKIEMIGRKTRELGDGVSKKDVTIDGITRNDNGLQTTLSFSITSSKG